MTERMGQKNVSKVKAIIMMIWHNKRTEQNEYFYKVIYVIKSVNGSFGYKRNSARLVKVPVDVHGFSP